jgi:hypothetical protein
MKNKNSKLNDLFSYLDEITDEKKDDNFKKIDHNAYLYEDNRGII